MCIEQYCFAIYFFDENSLSAGRCKTIFYRKDKMECFYTSHFESIVLNVFTVLNKYDTYHIFFQFQAGWWFTYSVHVYKSPVFVFLKINMYDVIAI